MAKFSGKLVIATHNAGKLAEFRELLAPHGVEAVGAGDLGLPEPEETGDSFEANAILKARAAAERSGFAALADDSGLCVEGLDGAPGIYSARWAKPDGFDGAMRRIQGALVERGAPKPWRAHFISVLALCRPDGQVETFEGRIDGALNFPPRGTAGFGYDPIFTPDGHGRSFGEMTSIEKHGLPTDGSLALSHRARAFQSFEKVCL